MIAANFEIVKIKRLLRIIGVMVCGALLSSCGNDSNEQVRREMQNATVGLCRDLNALLRDLEGNPTSQPVLSVADYSSRHALLVDQVLAYIINENSPARGDIFYHWGSPDRTYFAWDRNYSQPPQGRQLHPYKLFSDEICGTEWYLN